VFKIINIYKSKSINNNTATYESSKLHNVKKFRRKAFKVNTKISISKQKFLEQKSLVVKLFFSIRTFITSIQCMFQEKSAKFALLKLIILNH
jgi:hypothetical protein